MEIDWLSDESHVLLNPRMPAGERRGLEASVVPLPGQVWLATSGTSGVLKLAALSKRAMLASAAAVNRHLQATADDVWCCVLPTFHVGGLAIYARGFLSRGRVISAAWDPSRFAATEEMTLASLVPAQVSDLVRDGIEPPARLRAAVVGGGAISGGLYRAARDLGWPILPSYGMTECCSQVATATLGSPDLVLLDHFEAGVDEEGRLAFRGEALLTGYGTTAGFIDPKVDGWFVTEDLGSLSGRVLTIYGRAGEFIKIGGESVDLARLDRILEAVAGSHAAIFAVPDERLGYALDLAVDASVDGEAVAAAYAERVHPFERARRVYRVAEIPRSPLGKLIRSALLDAVRDGDPPANRLE